MGNIFNFSRPASLRCAVLNWSCRKVGGIWFIKLGRFGGSFYLSSMCRDYPGGRKVVVNADG